MRIITTTLLIILIRFSLAQSLLNVQCYQDPSDAYNNQFSLDGNVIAYGILSYDPSFHVAVFDTACNFWTRPEPPGEPTYGSIEPSLPQIYNYFAYDQDDVMSLTYLDSLINFWIPADHAFVIFTPISYNGSLMASINPVLAQTFQSRWGPASIQTQSMLVLFGVQGYPNSFIMDTLTTGNYIDFNVEICPHYEQIALVNTQEDPAEKFRVFPNPGNDEIKFEIIDPIYSEARLYDNHGSLISRLTISEYPSEYVITGHLSGVYYLQLFRGSEVMATEKVVVTD